MVRERVRERKEGEGYLGAGGCRVYPRKSCIQKSFLKTGYLGVNPAPSCTLEKLGGGGHMHFLQT